MNTVKERKREIWKKATRKYRATHDLKKKNAKMMRIWRNRNKKKAAKIEKKYRDSHVKELRERRIVKNKNFAKISSIRKKEKRNTWFAFAQSQGKTRCSKCGYDKCFSAIDFHHLEQSSKKMQMSLVFANKITPERIEEFNKCIPLCKNCHTELHESLKNGG